MTNLNNYLNINIITEKKREYSDLQKILELEFYLEINILSKSRKNIINTNKTNLFIIDLKDPKYFESVVGDSECHYIGLSKKPLSYKGNISNVRIIQMPFRLYDLILYIDNLMQLKIRALGQKVSKDYSYSYDKAIFLNKKTGKKVRLTDMENKFINYLFSSDMPVTKNEILSKVWGYKTDLDTHTLESLVYRIRKKIENDPRNPKIISSIGSKYRIDL